MLRSLRLLLITGWCGMTWTIGYVVAPTLFRMLDDRMLAGSLAGALFRLQGWTSVGVALLLLWMTVAVGMRGRVIWRDPDVRIVLGMLLCTLIGYFALQPLMQGLKELMAVHGPAVPDEIRQRFGIVHGVSATFYLAHSMLGLWLVLRQAGWPAQP
nr:DUF4149 domain-containing protein [Derxia gummosa]